MAAHRRGCSQQCWGGWALSAERLSNVSLTARFQRCSLASTRQSHCNFCSSSAGSATAPRGWSMSECSLSCCANRETGHVLLELAGGCPWSNRPRSLTSDGNRSRLAPRRIIHVDSLLEHCCGRYPEMLNSWLRSILRLWGKVSAFSWWIGDLYSKFAVPGNFAMLLERLLNLCGEIPQPQSCIPHTAPCAFARSPLAQAQQLPVGRHCPRRPARHLAGPARPGTTRWIGGRRRTVGGRTGWYFFALASGSFRCAYVTLESTRHYRSRRKRAEVPGLFLSYRLTIAAWLSSLLVLHCFGRLL